MNEIQCFFQLLKSSLNTLFLKRTKECLIGTVIESVNEHTPREWQDSRSCGLVCYRPKLFIYIPDLKNNRREARNFIFIISSGNEAAALTAFHFILAYQPNLQISETCCLLDQALRYRIPASIFISSTNDINYYKISPWVVLKNLGFLYHCFCQVVSTFVGSFGTDYIFRRVQRASKEQVTRRGAGREIIGARAWESIVHQGKSEI